VSDIVLITGPPLAGVTSLVEELRRRMPGRCFVEAPEMDAGTAPAAVVFVVSAIAPMTESDCALADLATTQTDVVVAVVSKVDDHRDWRGVLSADRERLGEYTARLRHVAWVGAAAAPRLGEPVVDQLVELLGRQLDDPGLTRRNSLRAWESRVLAEMSRLHSEAAGGCRQAQVDALRGRREELLRQGRLSRSDSSIALRSRIQQARVALMYSARNRCASARTELLELVAATSRRAFGDVEQCVRRRCRDIAAEVDEEISTQTRDVAAELGVMEPPRPPPMRMVAITDPPVRSRRLETQLMTVLGAGFGLGVAVVVSRLFAGLSPEPTVAGMAASAVVGLAITVWIVRIRALLHDRAVLDRWVSAVITAVRSAAEERVVTRMLAAEAALMSAYIARGDAQRLAAGQQIPGIDSELRELASATARAEAARDRELPSLQRTLEAIREALPKLKSPESFVTGR
jgi:hypothetical protein